jgi:hypothetical protein
MRAGCDSVVAYAGGLWPPPPATVVPSGWMARANVRARGTSVGRWCDVPSRPLMSL